MIIVCLGTIQLNSEIDMYRNKMPIAKYEMLNVICQRSPNLRQVYGINKRCNKTLFVRQYQECMYHEFSAKKL